MTQEQVAVHLGITQQAVSQIELEALRKFADAIVDLADANERFRCMLEEAFR
jgi:transcriptional regulator with XRE-family HTH domain